MVPCKTVLTLVVQMLFLKKFSLGKGVASYADFEKFPIIGKLSYRKIHSTFKVINNNNK